MRCVQVEKLINSINQLAVSVVGIPASTNVTSHQRRVSIRETQLEFYHIPSYPSNFWVRHRVPSMPQRGSLNNYKRSAQNTFCPRGMCPHFLPSHALGHRPQPLRLLHDAFMQCQSLPQRSPYYRQLDYRSFVAYECVLPLPHPLIGRIRTFRKSCPVLCTTSKDTIKELKLKDVLNEDECKIMRSNKEIRIYLASKSNDGRFFVNQTTQDRIEVIQRTQAISLGTDSRYYQWIMWSEVEAVPCLDVEVIWISTIASLVFN